MKASERALHWNAQGPAVRPAGGSLAVALNRRQLLLLTGAAAAGLSIAGPLAPAGSSGGSASHATSAATLAVALGSLTAVDFFGLLGESFGFEALTGPQAGATGRFTLSGVSVPDPGVAENRPADARPLPFALLFALEEGAIGTSGIARVEHASIGRMEIFVHAVLQHDPGQPQYYEAVFN